MCICALNGRIKEDEVLKKVPLSLEELLAKKKAEEAAQSKVCKINVYLFCS